MKHSLWSPTQLLCLQAAFHLSPVSAADDWIWAKVIPRTGWQVTSDSFHSGQEARYAIDGNTSTFWHSNYVPDAPLPHYIQVDMGKLYVVNGIDYLPRQDGLNGRIGQHSVTLSADNRTWTEPVAFGTWLNDGRAKQSFFTITTARYVRLTAQSEAQGLGYPYTSVAEFNVYSPDPAQDASTFRGPTAASQGAWDVTIDFPISPAAGALSYENVLILWSAFRADRFDTQGQGITETVTWNPASRLVSRRSVAETGHDMFCPGLSMDAEGIFIVNGGNDVRKTSEYIASTDSWKTAAQMNIARGYQSATTIADGRTFVLGGSWSGGVGGKNGEIFSTTANVWQSLPGASVSPILTQDAQGVYRSDNHAWLFAWGSNSVFHAGPSRAMNWYHVDGTGSWKAAGTRLNDPDSMCGISVMYDAGSGLILTAGGSPSYQYSEATSNAHIIKLGAVDANPSVTKIANMAYRRAFANGVVLPNGKVLVVGGQTYPVPFTDTTAILPAELFDPATNRFTEMAPIVVPRTYHSIALLTPDGRVFSAGGGLCGTGCKQNHFDGQLWSPPYLFNADGSRARRPVIQSTGSVSLKPGATLTVTTDVAATFSLLRYGSSTHTVNTDQRRVLLTGSASGLTYTLRLPSEPGVLLAGYWMLFALNSQGVPSVSTRVKILLP